MTGETKEAEEYLQLSRYQTLQTAILEIGNELRVIKARITKLHDRLDKHEENYNAHKV